MKLTNILTLLLVLFVAASCSVEQKSNEEKDTPTTGLSMEKLLKSGNCFDQKMEKWFVTFNKLQEEGLDMKVANEKAIAFVDVEFKTCDSTSEE